MVYIALFLILSAFYEELHNQDLVMYLYIYVKFEFHLKPHVKNLSI